MMGFACPFRPERLPIVIEVPLPAWMVQAIDAKLLRKPSPNRRSGGSSIPVAKKLSALQEGCERSK